MLYYLIVWVVGSCLLALIFYLLGTPLQNIPLMAGLWMVVGILGRRTIRDARAGDHE